ncbi:hypothetical protein HDV05_000622 [Chytridiales sp. JEL 0842]|nr:hypothetical protein HDV05_000622 [Chytridiales sp. JEL 0842]
MSSHMAAFVLGGLFTVFLLSIALIMVLRSLPDWVSPTKSKSAAAARRRWKNADHDGDRSNVSPRSAPSNPDKSNSYDPKLTKVGWMRISSRPLEHAELWMDERGSPSKSYLGSLGESNASNTPPSISETIGPPVRLRKTTSMLSGVTSITESALSVVETGLQASNYIVARFLGETPPLPPMVAKPQPPVPNNDSTSSSSPPPRPPWRNVFVVLKHKSLFIYSSDERLECLDVLLLPQYNVEMWPRGGRDSELYNRDTPIRLHVRPPAALSKPLTRRRHRHHSSRSLSREFSSARPPTKAPPSASSALGSDQTAEIEETSLFLYLLTGSDKEDWFFMLRRTSLLPAYSDSGALSAHFEESPEYNHFQQGMKKLFTDLQTSARNTTAENAATVWLNALLGRAFVGLHANPRLKDWIIRKLSRKTGIGRVGSDSTVLGDIEIRDVSVGDSIPILSNPKMLDFSLNGDLNIQVDITYTGGCRIEAETLATISLPSFEPYFKPLPIPIVVSIKVTRFSARLLLKIKPFWETSRIWFGLYRDPEIDIGVEVEPIIWNKLIKLNVVDQIIQRRIKQALEEFVVLPNMDDISFWPTQGKGGIFWDIDDSGNEESSVDDGEEYEEEVECDDVRMEEESFSGDEGFRQSSSLPYEYPTTRNDGMLRPEYDADGLPYSDVESTATPGGLDADDDPYGGRYDAPSEMSGAAGKSGEEAEDDDEKSIFRHVEERMKEEALDALMEDARWAQERGLLSDDDNDQLYQQPTDIDAPPSEQSELSLPHNFAIASSSLPVENQNASLSPSTSSTTSTLPPKQPSTYFEYLAETAAQAGQKSREYKLDELAKAIQIKSQDAGSKMIEKGKEWSDSTLRWFGYAPIGESTSSLTNLQGTGQPSRSSIGGTFSESAPEAEDNIPKRPPKSRPLLKENAYPQPTPPQQPPPPTPKQRPSSMLLDFLGINISTTLPPTSAQRKKRKAGRAGTPTGNSPRSSLDELRPPRPRSHLGTYATSSSMSSKPAVSSYLSRDHRTNARPATALGLYHEDAAGVNSRNSSVASLLMEQEEEEEDPPEVTAGWEKERIGGVGRMHKELSLEEMDLD